MSDTRPVLADLDGTLIDSRKIEAWVWTKWAAGHRLDPAPFLANQGVRVADLLARFAPHIPATEAALIAEMALACPLAADPLPGAAQLLLEPGAPFAIVTSGAAALARGLLAGAGFLPPAVMVTADDVIRGKPGPEPYQLAAALLDVSPRDCVVLEDTAVGVAAGVAAGMTVVAVTTTEEATALHQAGARLVVPDVAGFLRCREAGSLPWPRD
jgi:mannitol-1-/sugar-/sorbitol-6-phosphatase